MNSVKKCCKLCEHEPDNGASTQLKDRIERTTECRLALEGGTVLSVREITSEVDDIARRANLNCLCDEPSVESFASKKTKPKASSGKKKQKDAGSNSAPGFRASEETTKKYRIQRTNLMSHNLMRSQKSHQENENVDEMNRSAWQRFIKFMNDWKMLLSAIVETDGVCQKKFQALIKPKWFHQLSPKQVSLVDSLPSSLIDDADEGCVRRTRRFTRDIAMHPLPTLQEIKRAKEYTSTNAVLFLSSLLELTRSRTDKPSEIQNDEDLAKSTDDQEAEEQSEEGPVSINYEYSWNERLLMSAISYLEMPLLLQTLARRLPAAETQPFACPELDELSSYSPLTRKSSDISPYLKPVWETEPWNWVEERFVTAEIRRRNGRFLRKMACPPDINRSTTLHTHVLSHVPQPSVEQDRNEPLKKETCTVLKMVEKWLPELAPCPLTPAPSCASGSTKKMEVRGMLEEVLAALQDHTEDGCKCRDIPSGIVESIGELKARGLVCASFPSIEHHPSVLQFIKHLHGEELNRLLQASLFIKTDSAKKCISQLYQETVIPKQKKASPDSDWGRIEKLRRQALHQRTSFLHRLWKERCKNSQNLWHSFNPDIMYKRSFGPTFYAYMISGHDTVNFWPSSANDD